MSLNSTGLFVKRQLPAHLNEYNPRFVELLRAYQSYLNRGEGLNETETDMLNSEIESTYQSGELKYSKFLKYQHTWSRIQKQRSIGDQTQNLIKEFVLERSYNTFVSNKDEYFETSDGFVFEAKQSNNWSETEWMKRYGIDFSLNRTDLVSADQTLFVLALKRMFAAKGTLKCVEMFFSIFYGETVEVYIPKFDICRLDDNFILDSKKFLRDDDINQEYSYVVYVKNPPEKYSGAFSEIYMKNFHPSGFKVKLKQKT